MSAKYLIPALLVSLVAASANAAPASADPVRARINAELEQAKRDGNYPPSEADYVYPNWVKIANPAGVVMTDGHVEDASARQTAPVVARKADTATPAVALMSDGHPELETARTVKGGNSGN